MGKYRTFNQVEEEYYREHPEEIDGFLTVTFEEYAKDNDTGAVRLVNEMHPSLMACACR